MSPERKTEINGHTITEYYWAGDMVVYVNGRLSPMTYSAACEWATAALARQEQAA